MIAFSCGTLMGDIFQHIFPIVYMENNDENIKYTMIGLLLFMFIDQILKLSRNDGNNKCDHNNKKNVVIFLLGDLFHNLGDGLAIGSAF